MRTVQHVSLRTQKDRWLKQVFRSLPPAREEPGSSAEGRGTLHPRRSKRLSFCLPFTDCSERPSLCPVPQVLVNKVWAPTKANPCSLSLATTQGFCSLSLEMSQPTVGEKNCTSKSLMTHLQGLSFHLPNLEFNNSRPHFLAW